MSEKGSPSRPHFAKRNDQFFWSVIVQMTDIRAPTGKIDLRTLPARGSNREGLDVV